MLTTLTLGTRGSELALAQALMTEQALALAWPELRVVREIIHSTGDLRQDLKLAEFNRGPNPVDKGIFTKELEIALEAGKIDVAVHSLKDVPTELGAGFRIAAVLPRAATEDVLVSKFPGGLAALPNGALVATSSVRRARQLRWLRPDLQVEEIRGNVPTRIQKLATTERWSALLLARAGLDRLHLSADSTVVGGVTLYQETLSSRDFLPAASQGAVALEVYGENSALATCLGKLNHAPTFGRITAERHFLHLLKAGCQTPVGLSSTLKGDQLSMEAVIFSERDPAAAPQRSQATGPASQPESVAQALFENIT
jgi:hydroxymethylbilane synthase